ncbi:MAG: chromate resistance protein [Actinomycetota bacterium]|nr:chromate resistance protein [Actinomycetota bacterium]
MKWVTCAHTPAEGLACAWLILRFVDPEADVLYADAQGVPEVAEAEGACSFDAPEDGKPAFEAILEEYGWEGHPALERMVRVLCGGTGPEDEALATLCACVEAIVGELSALGFGDRRQLLELTLPLYDALYARCEEC